jgi:hypothetical protein
MGALNGSSFWRGEKGWPVEMLEWSVSGHSYARRAVASLTNSS